MNVRNCRNCGRIFNYMMGPIVCPACKDELEEKFHEVKEYIRDHKGVGIQQVSEDCGVSTNQIHQWLREERLELVEGSAITLQCETCGMPIASGRYCEKCKREVTAGFKNVLNSAKAPKQEDTGHSRDKQNPKMRYLERN